MKDEWKGQGDLPKTSQTEAPAYRLGFLDPDLMERDELRPVRLQLELFKPELLLNDHNIRSTIVVFGSARVCTPEEAAARCKKLEDACAKIPSDKSLARDLATARRVKARARYYEEARKFAHIVSEATSNDEALDYVIATGGGPGIMEAANRGAADAKAKSIGFNISLPKEQLPNSYISPELCFRFHYFALRKMHFMMRAKALVIFPGGFGTMDELMETLTLIQTGKIDPMPVILFGKEFWSQALNFDFLVAEGVIAPEDAEIVTFVENAEDAWAAISDFYADR